MQTNGQAEIPAQQIIWVYLLIPQWAYRDTFVCLWNPGVAKRDDPNVSTRWLTGGRRCCGIGFNRASHLYPDCLHFRLFRLYEMPLMA